MPLTAYSKFDYWNPGTGDMAVRYSGFSGHGEYWLSLPAAPGGKSRRGQRDWVLTLIEEAIGRGDNPGEVAYREPPEPSPISRF